MAIWRGVGGSGESTNDSTVPTVTALLVDAEAARDAAQLAETNAETAASNAASSASTASTQASNASTSATNAASSASSASTSATNAASSASTASTQASNAASSASAASTSATNAASSASSAASSASTATTKASEASTSATNAASSATAAASSASSAATQASNAASSASAASTSASNAATSESNAASSASAAAASYDSFDDRYLGAKSSAPTLDNDGNALLTGALYFNTSTNEMKVWSGSAWLNAYASLSGALLATNNLSDLNNVATARTNLGLGTAATQNSTAFATAAQGANADTAYGWGNHALAGYAADSAVVKLTGDQTIAGTKTFSSTISGSISGNAGTVTNGVYTTGDQTIAGTKTFSSNPILSAGTANGVVYLNGSKVATSGSALTFDGSFLNLSRGSSGTLLNLTDAVAQTFRVATTASTVNLDSASGGSLAFLIGSSEAMRLTSTGLGIGTSSPGQKLHVVGNIRTTNSLIEDTGTSVNFGTITAGYLAFLSGSGAERMRLDSSGNLGLGVTPSTSWASDPSATKAFQLSGGSIWSYSTSQFNLLQNAVWNGSNLLYANTAAASAYRQISGAHSWYTAASGTAGTSITFTQAMTLDASGNLGIGTSSPSTRLHAKGSGGTIATFERDASGTIAYFNRNAGSGNAGAIIGADSVAGYFAGGNSTSNMVYLDSVNNLAQFYTNGSERARIDSSGQMIIGATDVGRGDKLTVVGAGTLSTVTSSVRGLLAVESNSSTAQNVGGAISLGGNYDAGRTQFAAIGGYKESATSSDYAGYLAFFTRPSGDLTKERARITSGGYFKASNTGAYRSATTTHHEFYQTNNDPGLTVTCTNTSQTTNCLRVFAARNTTGNSYYAIEYYNDGADTSRFRVADSGNVTNTNNSYGAISDIKLKENITDATPKLAGLMQVRVRNYNLKSDPTHKQLGVIAQELEQVFPGMVEESPDRDADGNDLGTTTKQVKYSVFVPMLIKAIQEQQAIIEQLKADVAALKGA